MPHAAAPLDLLMSDVEYAPGCHGRLTPSRRRQIFAADAATPRYATPRHAPRCADAAIYAAVCLPASRQLPPPAATGCRRRRYATPPAFRAHSPKTLFCRRDAHAPPTPQPRRHGAAAAAARQMPRRHTPPCAQRHTPRRRRLRRFRRCHYAMPTPPRRAADSASPRRHIAALPDVCV